MFPSNIIFYLSMPRRRPRMVVNVEVVTYSLLLIYGISPKTLAVNCFISSIARVTDTAVFDCFFILSDQAFLFVVVPFTAEDMLVSPVFTCWELRAGMSEVESVWILVDHVDMVKDISDIKPHFPAAGTACADGKHVGEPVEYINIVDMHLDDEIARAPEIVEPIADLVIFFRELGQPLSAP